jgi:hypothetical protein
MIKRIRSSDRKTIETVALVGILVLAILARLWLLSDAVQIGLGRDELQSATHAFLKIPDLLASVAQFDPHPPLYYLQLHYWMALATSDLWLLLNSFVWGLLAFFSATWICTSLFNRRAGLLAGILTAFGLLSMVMSVSLRMYAMMFFLSLWVWYFTYQFMLGRRQSLMAFGVFVTSLAFLYAQGANFVVFLTSVTYVVFLTVNDRTLFPRLWKYLLLQLVILLLYLPWLTKAASIEVGHTVAPGLREFGEMATQVLFTSYGLRSDHATLVAAAATLIFMTLVVMLLVNRSSRWITAAYVLVPILGLAAISYTIRPIWATQSLSPIASFIYIGMALLVDRLLSERAKNTPAILGWVTVGLYCTGVLVGYFYIQSHYDKWVPLKQPVAMVKQNSHPGDTIYIPDERSFWGWNWYYLGPGSIIPLKTNYAIYEDGVQILGGLDRQSEMTPGGRYWIIRRSDVPFEINPNEKALTIERFDFGTTWVDLIRGNP